MEEYFFKIEESEFEQIYLFHKKYTDEKRSLYVWLWEYGNINPFPSVLIGVKFNNQLIASQGMFCIKLNTGSKIELTGKNESLLVEKEFRGTGLSKRLYDFAIKEYEKENISCLWGFSKKALVPLKKANFNVHENIIKRAVLSLNYNHSLKLARNENASLKSILITKLKIILGTSYCKAMFYYKIKKYSKKNEFEFRSKLKDTNDIMKLYDNIRIKYPNLIHIHQDNEYYNWRIEKSPVPIEKIFMYKDENLIAYSYVTFFQDYSEITDLTFMNNKHGNILLNIMYELFLNKGSKFIFYNFNCKNELNLKVANLLKSFGLIITDGPNHFVTRNFRIEATNYFYNINRWYISGLWSEGI